MSLGGGREQNASSFVCEPRWWWNSLEKIWERSLWQSEELLFCKHPLSWIPLLRFSIKLAPVKLDPHPARVCVWGKISKIWLYSSTKLGITWESWHFTYLVKTRSHLTVSMTIDHIALEGGFKSSWKNERILLHRLFFKGENSLEIDDFITVTNLWVPQFALHWLGLNTYEPPFFCPPHIWPFYFLQRSKQNKHVCPAVIDEMFQEGLTFK